MKRTSGQSTAAISTSAGTHPRPPRVQEQTGWPVVVPPPHPRPARWRRLYLVGRGQSRPGFVCPSVIVLSFGHFHVIAESDQNLPVPQFIHRGSLIQLKSEMAREPPAATPASSRTRADGTCLQGRGHSGTGRHTAEASKRPQAELNSSPRHFCARGPGSGEAR